MSTDTFHNAISNDVGDVVVARAWKRNVGRHFGNEMSADI